MAFRLLGVVQRVRAGVALRRLLRPRDPRLEVTAFGLTFDNPLGVAAGMDKEAECFEVLGDLGFGHVEVGTVTARPQGGNARPRIGRVPEDRAVYNRMGFPNPGAEVFAQRLRAGARHTVIGVNIGKSRDVELADAADDYRASVRALAGVADYLAINVSSPNTPGLRSMQSADELRKLVEAVRAEMSEIGQRRPLLVKIAPDLSDDELDAIADLAVEIRLDGIIAVNTTVDIGVLEHEPKNPDPERALGGISGAPLKHRALEVLRHLRQRVGDDVTLVSVGGIETADDAWERIAAGASLVQAHTGYIYGGPLWPRRLNRQLARRVTASGYASIQDVIGKATAADAGARLESTAPQRAGAPAVSRSTRVA